MHGFLEVSVHFIDDAFNLRNCVLACTRFSGQHDAATIFSLAVEVIISYEIHKKVYFIGTNNGANIV